MNDSFSLGRIAGIRIGVNWSWLLVFGLITWSLATQVFPESNPAQGGAARLAMAVSAALLFFASILLHELGHALEAKRQGMVIDGITLWLFGGVARFRGRFRTWGSELLIALAGPAVSLLLAGAFLGLGELSLPPAVDGVVTWLGVINLTVLIFNLLPALPLDGGRVLRAILWGARGDFAWATGIAAFVGRGFGWLLIAGGAVMFAAYGAFGGAWLAFIGWFLLQAVRGESRALEAQQALGGLLVSDLMIREPLVAHADETLEEFAADVVWPERHAAYPVVAGEWRPVGMLAAARLAEAPRAAWGRLRVREVMHPLDSVPVVGVGDTAFDALTAFTPGGLDRALVLDGERCVGLLAAEALLRALREGAPTPPATSVPGR